MQIRFFEVEQSRTDGQGQLCGQMDRGIFVDKWRGAVSSTNGQEQYCRPFNLFLHHSTPLSIPFCPALHPPPFLKNKAGYTATEVACGWAGAIFEVTRPFRQQQ